MGRSAAVALMALLLAVPLALLSPLGDDKGGNPRRDSVALEPLEGPGMRAELPTGWDGRIEYIAGGAPAFEGANFPLTAVPLIAHPTSAQQTIVAIVDWTTTCQSCPGFEPVSLPLSVDSADFEARSGLPNWISDSKSLPESHDFVRLAFRIEQRYFTLLVEAGSRPITERSLSEVNAVLESWVPTGSFEPPPSEGICPEGGPWIDPDCPEAQWVMGIIRRAGFRLEGDTGGAFTIRREGPLLNIWKSDRVSASNLRAEGYDPWFRVGDTQVFSGESWVTWIAGDATVWVRPRLGGDEPPPEDDIARLVEASQGEPFVSRS